MLRHLAPALALVVLLAASASGSSLFRIDDERREVALGAVGNGILVADGAGDLVSFSYGWSADDFVMVFELADVDARMYSVEEAPRGERLYAWADAGDITAVAIRGDDGSVYGDSYYRYGPWPDGSVTVYPETTRVTLDAEANTIVVTIPGIRPDVDEKGVDWHGGNVVVHDFACREGGCNENPLSRTYGDKLVESLQIYAERGSCRHVTFACVDTMGLPLSRPDL